MIDLNDSGTRGNITRVDILKMTKQSPHNAAILSKLTHSQLHGMEQVGQGMDTHAASIMAMETARRRDDARMALDVFPDVKLAGDTLVGLILSPSDGVTTEFKYEFTTDIGLPAAEIAAVVTMFKEYLEKDLDIRRMAHNIVHRAMITDGAAPVLVLPESSLDHFLNNPGSLVSESESGMDPKTAFKMGLVNELDKIYNKDGTPRSLGLLVDPVSSKESNIFKALESSFSLKQEDYDPYMVLAVETDGATRKIIRSKNTLITDNVNVVRMPLVQRRIQEMQAKQIEEHARLGYTRYNGDNASKTSKALKISDDNIRDLVYRRPSSPTSGVFAAIRAPEYINRRTVGKPLIKFWPVEALIVLTSPSDPRDRTHYIGILEQDGNPVKINDYSDGYGVLSRQFSGMMENNDVTISTMNRLAETRMNGFNTTNSAYDKQRMLSRVYSQLFEADFKARLRHSLGSGDLNMGSPDEVYDNMLARDLANKQTQMLLLPGSLVNYFAFNIDENGVGRSLLDDSRNILSVRTMLLVTEVFNSIRNAISRTNIEVGFDPRDKDPLHTAELIKTNVLASRGAQLPWGTFDLGSLSQHIQRAGLEFTYTGDNKAMLNTSIRYTENQSQHQPMDQTFRDYLRDLSLAAFSMTPDLLEATGQDDLATAVKQNRAQLARRVSVMANEFNSEWKIFLRRLLRYNGDILNKLRSVIKRNLKAIYEHDKKAERYPEEFRTANVKVFKANIERYVDYIVEDYIDSYECTLPTFVRNSFADRVKEVEEKITALETVLKNVASGELFGTIFSDGTVVDNWVKQVQADCVRQWFAEAGIDIEISKYLEKPDIAGAGNVKSKAIDAYNNAIVLQILARAKEDAKTKQIVELVSKAYGLSEGDGSSEDSSGDTGTEDTGDGSTEASPEDDMFGELDFGGDALPDEGGSEEAAPEEPAVEEESAPELPTEEPEPKAEESAKEEEAPKDTTEEKKE